MIDRKKCEFQAIGDAELVEDVADVVLHGLFADAAPLPDIRVRISRYHQSHNLELTASETEILGPWTAGRRRRHGPQCPDQIGNALPSNPVLASHDAANAFEEP